VLREGLSLKRKRYREVGFVAGSAKFYRESGTTIAGDEWDQIHQIDMPVAAFLLARLRRIARAPDCRLEAQSDLLFDQATLIRQYTTGHYYVYYTIVPAHGVPTDDVVALAFGSTHSSPQHSGAEIMRRRGLV
jgi:hypothetical protein